jgi:hypothetical protein
MFDKACGPEGSVIVLMLIVLFSILFQLLSAFMAVRLIVITGKKNAWLLIALGISLMALRRIESLFMLFSGQPVTPSLGLFEVVGLITSVLMFSGIYYIKPLFTSLVRSKEELRAMNEQLKEALANIKALKGMLPICSSCKKIRDDKGYWSQIEAYISEHSEAEFTHGICPDCARKLYPEYSPETIITKKK